MKNFLPVFTSVVLASSWVSCSQTVSSRGDASTSGSGAFRTTTLPKFSLGLTGTHEWAVTGLDERAFPYKLRIYTSRAGTTYNLNTTFDDAVVKVELLDESSRKVLRTKTFDLGNWRGAGDAKYDLYFWSSDHFPMATRESYRVRVSVLKPSRRGRDMGRIYMR